ncbi:MAG: hypothetical protein J7K75_10330 [Desulfuromonas sp.]|nr:hypothetical protein [Desulfuromonas sp.]
MQQKYDKPTLIWNKLRFPPLNSLGVRATFLFGNFLLIIMALYQLKPASRSLFIEAVGTDYLPHVWIGTALVMGGLITGYHRLIRRFPRLYIVLSTCLLFSGLLVVFRLLLTTKHPAVVVAFYIFVDILGVVLVEQFWSLTNSIYSTSEGKSWYGYIGTGGLLGGVMGGLVAAMILRHTPLQTPDLLLVAAAILLAIMILTWVMGRLGIYHEVENLGHPTTYRGGWRVLKHSRYLMMIAAILLLAQLASPLVEYQFMKTVEDVYLEQEARTAFLSLFFSLLGGVSISVNLLVTSLVHRKLGVVAGLLAQPLLMMLCSLGFVFQPTLPFSVATKISDRGLSYSINRASKELLYVPIDSILIYQAKAWIDMFGYRLFKIFGSFIILFFTQWLPFRVSVPQLSWFTVAICLVWIGLILLIQRDYQKLS